MLKITLCNKFLRCLYESGTFMCAAFENVKEISIKSIARISRNDHKNVHVIYFAADSDCKQCGSAKE